MVLSKPIVIALGTALVIATAAAGYFYWRHSSVSEENAQLNQQLSQQKQDIADLELERFKSQQLSELNRALYDELQTDYRSLEKQRQSLSSELASLRENDSDASGFFDTCRMPDSVYEWVRSN